MSLIDWFAARRKDQFVGKVSQDTDEGDGLGIKCVEEEPWVTFAESSECIMALYKVGLKKEATKIFDEVLKHKNSKGYFPTGYQYDLGIYWPEEDSTWTNAAIIMAADCIHDITGKEKVILI